MKNNLVLIDPQQVEISLKQLERIYRLDRTILEQLKPIIERYPQAVRLYVDEARAQFMVTTPLDDLFTFDTETDELVLYSSDGETFINGLVEMWMYLVGFQTLMDDPEYWKIEFTIAAWKPIRDQIKESLSIPVKRQYLGTFGLPPEPDEAPLEDPYPFRTLVSTFNQVAFIQMIRLAGRSDIRVHFPSGTHPRVIEAYYTMRIAIKSVAQGLGLRDVLEFNQRLIEKLAHLEQRYQPETLPHPTGWFFVGDEQDEQDGPLRLNDTPRNEEQRQQEADQRLESGPFGQFIESLFDD